MSESRNLVLIGMAGAGKSTVGVLLARELGFDFMDVDIEIQNRYGERRLQEIVDEVGQDKFLDIEADVCASLNPRRTVIATGGSVIYRDRAMKHLHTLGPIVWLRVPLPEIERRIAAFPQRGLAIKPGQTIADLFNEREPLYSHYSDWVVDCSDHIEAVVADIRQRMEQQG
ncbi:MAG: homoserine kinase [Verrucomicrobiota bacterium JB022]|nr:homoserine kinase [Verrucomicrobiota bacterium JB022]